MQPASLIEQREIMPRNWVSRPAVPFLARFLGKFVLDIMPAALASVIGGFLFTQYQFGHTTPKPALEAVTPASAEMLALVRDEHAMIIDYLKAQAVAEKGKLVAGNADSHDADANATADAGAKPSTKSTDLRLALDTTAHRVAAASAQRPAPARVKSTPTPAPAPVVSAPHAPLVIAQADLGAPPVDPAVPTGRLARDPDSLLGKTLDIKDHVVAATGHVVSAIGDVFTSMGERIGSVVTGGRQFASDS
jgi:hypothetical protein